MVNGMSTRRGSVVFLEDLLNEAKVVTLFSWLPVLSWLQDRMRERIEQGAQTSDQMEHTAEAVGLAAIVVQDLKAKRIKVRRTHSTAGYSLWRSQDYEFQWDRMLQAEGDTGPLLMYTYARCCGIEGKSTFQVCDVVWAIARRDAWQASAEAAAHLTESQAEDVVLWVSRYEEACERALQQAEPSVFMHTHRQPHAFNSSRRWSTICCSLRDTPMPPMPRCECRVRQRRSHGHGLPCLPRPAQCWGPA
jgi:arginyl-tRNA synthetase